jgi:hypothetical protein
MHFQNSAERNLSLLRYLSIYNLLWKYSPLGAKSSHHLLDELLC